jgi:ferritin-like metal-binding protein YciE
MAAINSLRTHLVDELIDLLDAENQLTTALPKLAKSATSNPLRRAFQKHLKETQTHVARLNQAIRALGEKPKSKTCEGLQGLLEEGETMMKDTPAGTLRDAVMITGAQKVEHYEMASYGTAATYAKVLGENEVARLLARTLREEKAADRTLTQIAEGAINEKAAEQWRSHEEEARGTTEWARAGAAGTARQLGRSIQQAAMALGMAADRSRSSGRRSSRGRTTRKTGSFSRRRAGTRKR